jgi:tetratricopeptide (TPR) repeat protein
MPLVAAHISAGTARASPGCSRRCALAAALALLTPPARAVVPADGLAELQERAASAFASQDFAAANAALSQLVEAEPQNIAWLEGRAQVAVDAKNFEAALLDFNKALPLATEDGAALARLHSGRALALEGLARWEEALEDYNISQTLAQEAGFTPDPYIANSRGNVLSSLGRWVEARAAYSASSATFQGARGFRRGASTTSRLDGAIYSGINAALCLAQLGDVEAAAKELRGLSRRAPNSVDARAALAALAYAAGNTAEAESYWSDACSKQESCGLYRDGDYVVRIRRWPPRLVAALDDFLQLRVPAV